MFRSRLWAITTGLLPLLLLLLLLLLAVSVRGSSTDGIVTTSQATERRTTRTVGEGGVNGGIMGGDDDISIVYSDLDGTLLHYPSKVPKSQAGNRLLTLPPSSTGMKGVISSKTLQLVQNIRRTTGVKFVLVSGMRTSTFLQRLPYLPRADAYCTEGGGRIFYPLIDTDVDDGDDGKRDIILSPTTEDGTFVVRPQRYDGAQREDLMPFSIIEDVRWRERIERLAGTYGSPRLTDLARDAKTMDVTERDGLLWDYARDLAHRGLVLDTKGYSSCFRINRKHQPTAASREVFDSLLDGTIPTWTGLSKSINLSCIDIYPETSGKKNCCLYLASKFFPDAATTGGRGNGNNNNNNNNNNDDDTAAAFLSSRAVCLCDDDNDLEMAMACKHAYIPVVSSESMKLIMETHPDHFTLTTVTTATQEGGVNGSGTDSAEAALLSVLELLSARGQQNEQVELASSSAAVKKP